jgi:hypothetical protein
MTTTRRLYIDDVIYWVRSSGASGKDRVPMYYKGRCDRADEGRAVRCR